MTTHPPKRDDSLPPQLEQALAAALQSQPPIAAARLRAIRSGVFERIAVQRQYRLSDFFRWRVALPAALSLLLVGGALGWTVDQQLADAQDAALGAVVGDF